VLVVVVEAEAEDLVEEEEDLVEEEEDLVEEEEDLVVVVVVDLVEEEDLDLEVLVVEAEIPGVLEGGMLHGFSWQQLIAHEKKPSNVAKDIWKTGTYSRRRKNKRTISDLPSHNQTPHPHP
jgi:hypothetical protein